MNPAKSVIFRALCFSVACVWVGVYKESFLFCVFGGVFLGIALTVAVVDKALWGSSHEHL